MSKFYLAVLYEFQLNVALRLILQFKAFLILVHVGVI